MKHIRGIVEDGPALPLGATDDVSEAIECVLSTMSPRQREIAEHRLRYQRTTDEIARTLGVSPGTVVQHLARITEVLRVQLPLLLH